MKLVLCLFYYLQQNKFSEYGIFLDYQTDKSLAKHMGQGDPSGCSHKAKPSELLWIAPTQRLVIKWQKD